MKEIKVEIQITILTIVIAAAMVGSGFFVYNSFTRIVDSIYNEARPDLKLLLIKDIASGLTEVENAVRLYSLTGEEAFIQPYSDMNERIQQKLIKLKSFAVPGSGEIQIIDSIRVLTVRKLLIWDEIRALHYKKGNTHNTFSEFYSKIDTVIILPDTITFKREEKKGFFKRLLRKKDTTSLQPIIIDKSREKQIIKQEIAGIEQQIIDQSRKLQVQEKKLLEQNIQVTAKLAGQIDMLERNEQKRLEVKTIEADYMAAQTYRRLALFTIAAVLLLAVVLVLFFRNMQRNRAYQQILKKAKTEAEGLAKAKEAFVATVSHEMRTPVNAIYGLTGQLLQKFHSNEVTADLEIIQKSAEHLISLVNDTLDFSRIESQKLKIEQIDFLLSEVFHEVFILHKTIAASKGIELILNNKTAPDLVLKGDMFRLKQVLINLVSNALKFTNYGEIKLTAEGLENQDGIFLLKMEVSDTGIGIPAEDQEKIFDEFVQLDTGSTRRHRGAGLGLAIVKKLVNVQGGTVNVHSVPGKGSCFSVQIPYQKGDAETVGRKMESRIIVPERFRRFHFLLVDDEAFNLHLLKNILKKWGISFTEAVNGQDAVRFASMNKYDLIVMDIRMPVIDGFEAAKQIIKIDPEARIIALTATNRDEDLQESLRSGMKGLLQKPFAETDLFNAIIRFVPEAKDAALQKESLPSINLDELKKMTGGNESFFSEMLEMFIHTSENGLASIHDSFYAKNWNVVAETAHRLAAPAKHLMASSLYEALKTLENEAETNKNENEMTRLINSIEHEIKQINIFLRKKLSVDKRGEDA
ncbi:MAG: ATP-binding protein [Prolixibacteraceae bacterium]|jgi:signal transduction histidine kinase/response regulator of citrate/malate metabolism|nr:ATP-binding protein [Prolixibacteraceae bacterium]